VLAGPLIDAQRAQAIERTVLGLYELKHASELSRLLGARVSPIFTPTLHTPSENDRT